MVGESIAQKAGRKKSDEGEKLNAFSYRKLDFCPSIFIFISCSFIFIFRKQDTQEPASLASMPPFAIIPDNRTMANALKQLVK